jgi:NADPH-dependent curcumin reductase CurA
MNTNQQIIFTKRPNGIPSLQNFSLQKVPVPQPEEGQILIKTIYFSLDPYMRGRMNEGPSYVPPMNTVINTKKHLQPI